MPVSDAYRDFALEQLRQVGGVTWRRMFGGAGLYADGVFFAVLDDDQLFFKVNDETRPAYQALGARPFEPMPGREQPMMGYFEVPASVLDDRDQVVAWARQAVEVALEARGSRMTRMTRKTRKVRSAREASRERQVARGVKAGITPAAILRPFPPRVRALANRLRALVKRAVPSLREAAYPGWKAVGYRHADAGYVCGVFPAFDCVRLIFEHGAQLDDPNGLLEGRGKVRQVRYVTVRVPGDIKVRALTRVVRAAVAARLMSA